MDEGSIEAWQAFKKRSNFFFFQNNYFQAAAFRENMFFSDEPGYYEAGAYGIRLETIMRTVSAQFGEDGQTEQSTVSPLQNIKNYLTR